MGGGIAFRIRHHTTSPAPAPASTAISTPAAMSRRGGGIAVRSRNGTWFVKVRVSQLRSRAMRPSSRSALTATGWPTTSSIGTSVAESL